MAEITVHIILVVWLRLLLKNELVQILWPANSFIFGRSQNACKELGKVSFHLLE